MDESKLTRVALTDLSSLQHEIFTFRPRRLRDPRFLVLRYSGIYRDGGAGRDDATFMLASREAALQAWPSQCLVVDLRGLTYRWGDEMIWAVSSGRLGSRDYPLRLVVGDGCRAALRSLLAETYSGVCVESLGLAYAACRRDFFERRGRPGA